MSSQPMVSDAPPDSSNHTNFINNEADPAASVAPLHIIPRAQTNKSIVWDHFTKFMDPTDGQVKSKCNYCGKTYKCDSRKIGNTTMKNHTFVCKMMPAKLEARQTQLSLQPIGEGSVGSLEKWSYDEKAIREALAYMLIVDELPFKFVEGEGFKRFVRALCPRFKIPSRWTITRDCYQLYLDEKNRLKFFLKTSGQHVCLTTDTWTSIQQINYMVITAHYIDSNWKLNKKVINFCTITSHKGEDIGRAIEDCLLEWGLEKIFTITVDNASSNDTAISYMRDKIVEWNEAFVAGKYIHMRCVAHIVNLIVSNGLDDVDAKIKKVRNAIRYIRASPARLKKFKECCEYEKIESKKSLCLDVPTRWNSTYLMLSTAIPFEKAFYRLDSRDPNYRKDLGARDIPQKDEWEAARSMAEMLQGFYKFTLRVSGSRYVTCNTVFHEISDLLFLISCWQQSPFENVKSMANRMREKFDKYWGDVEKMNKLIYVAIALDPRDKLEYLEFTLQQMHGINVGTKLFLSVKEALIELFNAYHLKYHVVSTTSSDINVSCGGADSAHSGMSSIESQKPAQYFKKQKLSMDGGASKKNELEVYLGEAVVDDKGDFDLLKWWKLNFERFPILARIARDVLAVPVSTVASESAFSTGGRVLDDFRSSLTPKIVQALICVQDWYKGTHMSIEEEIEELDKFEEGLPSIGNSSSKSLCGETESSSAFDLD